MSNSSTFASVIPHSFNGNFVYQVSESGCIGTNYIPKGYCNLTQILKAASEETGKRKSWNNYWKADSTQEFLLALSEENKQDIVSNDASETTTEFQPLVIIIKGGLHGNVKIEQGTWGHIEVAIHLAYWASSKFAVKATKTLRAVIENRMEGLYLHAICLKEELKSIWKELREVNKESFWGLGGAIDEYIEAHIQTLSDNYLQWIYRS